MGDMTSAVITNDGLNEAKKFIFDQKDPRSVGLTMETLNKFLLTSAADFKKALNSSKGDIGPLAAWVLAVGLKAGYEAGLEQGYTNGYADGCEDGYDQHDPGG